MSTPRYQPEFLNLVSQPSVVFYGARCKSSGWARGCLTSRWPGARRWCFWVRNFTGSSATRVSRRCCCWCFFLALAKTLVRLEEQGNDGRPRGGGWFAGMALWAGALAGLGGLTRYGFAWVILPVLVYLGWFLGRHRGRAVAMALLGFLLVMSPWLVRNAQLSGNLFGTAGLALYGQTVRLSRGYARADFVLRAKRQTPVKTVRMKSRWGWLTMSGCGTSRTS